MRARSIELGVGWVGNYDSLDMASLDLQAHGPFVSQHPSVYATTEAKTDDVTWMLQLYLLSSFYGISATTALLALAVDLLSTAIPFHLLRPLSGPHSGNAKVNQDIIADIYIQASTTLLAASIYGVAIVSAFRTFLPKQLVLYFSSIQSVRPAYEASYVTLFPIALVFGLTAHTFIFTPFAATDKAEEDDQLAKFDPVSATLNETVYYNVWGFATKTKVAILRTAVLATVSGVSTYLQCAMAINGVESPGAAAYAGIWAVPGLLSGLALGLVGGV